MELSRLRRPSAERLLVVLEQRDALPGERDGREAMAERTMIDAVSRPEANRRRRGCAGWQPEPVDRADHRRLPYEATRMSMPGGRPVSAVMARSPRE
jgi:hypothetical protein